MFLTEDCIKCVPTRLAERMSSTWTAYQTLGRLSRTVASSIWLGMYGEKRFSIRCHRASDLSRQLLAARHTLEGLLEG